MQDAVRVLVRCPCPVRTRTGYCPAETCWDDAVPGLRPEVRRSSPAVVAVSEPDRADLEPAGPDPYRIVRDPMVLRRAGRGAVSGEPEAAVNPLDPGRPVRRPWIRRHWIRRHWIRRPWIRPVPGSPRPPVPVRVRQPSPERPEPGARNAVGLLPVRPPVLARAPGLRPYSRLPNWPWPRSQRLEPALAVSAPPSWLICWWGGDRWPTSP